MSMAMWNLPTHSEDNRWIDWALRCQTIETQMPDERDDSQSHQVWSFTHSWFYHPSSPFKTRSDHMEKRDQKMHGAPVQLTRELETAFDYQLGTLFKFDPKRENHLFSLATRKIHLLIDVSCSVKCSCLSLLDFIFSIDNYSLHAYR